MTNKKINTEAELGDALKNKAEYIELEGDLANKVFKIRATGRVAWAIAFGAIGVAFYTALRAFNHQDNMAKLAMSSADHGVKLGFVAAPAVAAVSVLGLSATYSAIMIAVAAGTVGALTSLRGYEQVSYEKDRLVLVRK